MFKGLTVLAALSFFVACLATIDAAAQNMVTGTVVSAEDKKPLPRVRVAVQGTSRSVNTDARGQYTIGAAGGATLVFSLAGRKTVSEAVRNRRVIDVSMERETLEAQVDQVVVLLPGNTAWKTTGLVVREGDQIELKATGRVCFNQNDQPASCVGPEGYAPQHPNPPAAYESDYRGTDAAYCDDPRPDWAHACLIAKDRNGVFFVGNGRTVTGRRGPLEIGINDCTLQAPPQFRNSGSFSVVIRVVRRP